MERDTKERPGKGAAIAARLEAVRRAKGALEAPPSPEDALVQSVPDASPAKWRLGHTAWFYPDARWQFSGVRLARDA